MEEELNGIERTLPIMRTLSIVPLTSKRSDNFPLTSKEVELAKLKLINNPFNPSHPCSKATISNKILHHESIIQEKVVSLQRNFNYFP